MIFPPSNEVFSAFELTPLADVKVVILGQDPYHNVGQAHGLCFSVNRMWKFHLLLWIFTKNCMTISAVIFLITDIWWNGQSRGCWCWIQYLRSGRTRQIHTEGLAGKNLPMLRSGYWMNRTDRSYLFFGAVRRSAKGNAEQSEASDSGGTTSEPVICIQRIFGSKPFSQTNAFWRKWFDADWLADWESIDFISNIGSAGLTNSNIVL